MSTDLQTLEVARQIHKLGVKIRTTRTQLREAGKWESILTDHLFKYNNCGEVRSLDWLTLNRFLLAGARLVAAACPVPVSPWPSQVSHITSAPHFLLGNCLSEHHRQ